MLDVLEAFTALDLRYAYIGIQQYSFSSLAATKFARSTVTNRAHAYLHLINILLSLWRPVKRPYPINSLCMQTLLCVRGSGCCGIYACMMWQTSKYKHNNSSSVAVKLIVIIQSSFDQQVGSISLLNRPLILTSYVVVQSTYQEGRHWMHCSDYHHLSVFRD